MSKLSKNTGHDIKVGGSAAGTSPPSVKAFQVLAKARQQRAEALKKFARGGQASGAVSGLVDALVDYDKIRYGRMWKPSDADRLAKVYRKAFGSGDLAGIDFSALGRRSSPIRKLTRASLKKKFGDGPIVPYDGTGVVINPADTGWYYETHFDYSGGGYVTRLTFERYNEPTIGGDVTGTLHDPGAEGHVIVSAETGRWFDFTATQTGRPSVICFFKTIYNHITRLAYPKEAPGHITTIQTIDGCVGLLSDGMFLARNYVRFDGDYYGGDGTVFNMSDKDAGSIGGFLQDAAMPIEAGEKVQVLFGIQAKIYSAFDTCGASMGTAFRAEPTDIGAEILEHDT